MLLHVRLGLLTVRKGWLVIWSTLFSVRVCAISSLATITSFFRIFIANTSDVDLSLHNTTLPNVPLPRTLRISKSSMFYSVKKTCILDKSIHMYKINIQNYMYNYLYLHVHLHLHVQLETRPTHA